MKRNQKHGMRKILTAAALIVSLTVPMSAAAAPAYESDYTETTDMATLLAPALMKNTDPTGVALQLSTALRYGSITQGDIWNLIQAGCNIPAESLRLLYEQGQICGYIYKTVAGNGYTEEDFAEVYNAEDYAAQNPAIAEALANGTLTESELFLNFLSVGMPNGLVGSKNFSPAVFEEKYPDIAEDLNYDKASYYVWYLIYGEEKNVDASID